MHHDGRKGGGGEQTSRRVGEGKSFEEGGMKGRGRGRKSKGGENEQKGKEWGNK